MARAGAVSVWTMGVLAWSLFAPAGGAGAQPETATAVVEVVSEPPLHGVTLDFTGVPAGALVLSPDTPARLSATALGAGTHTSTLGPLPAAVQAAGYALTGIECDDVQSAAVSAGDLVTQTASFRVEDGEVVKCVFRLAAGGPCLCPKEGRWQVQNHPGSMECTGTMSMTLPLAPRGAEGTIEVAEDCASFVATGMSDDEAPVSATRNDSCGYVGTAGGEEGGMPLTIHFSFVVESEEHMTGELSATVQEQGTTCVMSRSFEAHFAQ